MDNESKFLKIWKKNCSNNLSNFLMKNLIEAEVYYNLLDNIDNNFDIRDIGFTPIGIIACEKFYSNIVKPLITYNNYSFINDLSDFITSIFNSKSEEFIFDYNMAEHMDFFPSETEGEYYHFMNLLSIIVKNFKEKVHLKYHGINHNKINLNIISINRSDLRRLINLVTPTQYNKFDDGLCNLFDTFKSSIDLKGAFITSNISTFDKIKRQYTCWQLFGIEPLIISSNSYTVLFSIISSFCSMFITLIERLYKQTEKKFIDIIYDDDISFRTISDLIALILIAKLLINSNIDPFRLNVMFNPIMNLDLVTEFIFDDNIKGIRIIPDSSTFCNDELKILINNF